MYLSRDRAIAFAAYDKLSPAGEDVFKALQNIKNIQLMSDLVNQIKELDQEEAEILLHRVFVVGRSEQWMNASLGQALHIIKAYPVLGNQLASELMELPATSRTPALATGIKEEEWANEIVQKWSEDPITPGTTRTALKRS